VTSSRANKRLSRAAAFLVVMLFATLAWSADEKAAPQIRALKAHLYYHETGTVGVEDVASNVAALWNTVIGAGDAKGPSSALLVTVTMVGAFPAKAGTTLIVESARGGGAPSVQSIPLEYFFSDRDTITVPVLLHGVGCEDLILSAAIGGSSDKVRVTVPFRCGE